jgi:hypothetical protein
MQKRKEGQISKPLLTERIMEEGKGEGVSKNLRLPMNYQRRYTVNNKLI